MAIKKYTKGEVVKLRDTTDQYTQYIGQEVTIDFVGSVGYMVVAKDGKRFAIDVTCIEGWQATQEPLRTTKKAAPKSTDFEYNEGEVVLVRSYKYSSVPKQFWGKQAVITYIRKTGTAKYNTTYSLKFEDGLTTTAFIDEIRPFPTESAQNKANSAEDEQIVNFVKDKVASIDLSKCAVPGCENDRMLFEKFCHEHIKAETGKIPVTIDNLPTSNNGTQTIFIDGMPYVVAAWGEEMANGFRSVIVRAA